MLLGAGGRESRWIRWLTGGSISGLRFVAGDDGLAYNSSSASSSLSLGVFQIGLFSGGERERESWSEALGFLLRLAKP